MDYRHTVLLLALAASPCPAEAQIPDPVIDFAPNPTVSPAAARADRAGPPIVEINVLIGVRSLPSTWGALDQPLTLGLHGTWGKRSWPVAVATDLLISGDSEGGSVLFFEVPPRAESTIVDFDFGVRKITLRKRLRAFVGGGVSFTRAEISGSSVVGEHDIGHGLWIDAGVYGRLGQALNLGLQARWGNANVDVLGRSLDAGGLQFTILFGYGFD